MSSESQISQFPNWNTMVVLDVTMVVLALLTTAIALRYWVFLAGAHARTGVFLILGSFWALASLYIYDLFIMVALPKWIGMAAAMERMSLLHQHHSFYVQVGAAGLLCLGLWTTCRRLAKQHERVSAARAEAERQSRHKTNFLAAMSHELRTPLNAIIGYAQLMQLPAAGESTARYREYAGHIQSSGEMLLGMIEDLLDLSRIEQGRLALTFERFDAAALVRQCIQALEPLAAGGRITVSVTASPGLPLVHADARAIEQVTLNLISNAMKHTPPGGRICVELDVSGHGHLRFVFSDTGTGIPEHLLPEIFEPYVHGDPLTQESQRSHGLGLAICKHLIDAHGGTIDIESAPGQGTTVTVTLPRRPKDVARASAAA